MDELKIVQDCKVVMLSAGGRRSMDGGGMVRLQLLTCNAGEELACEALYLAVWEWNEGVAL